MQLMKQSIQYLDVVSDPSKAIELAGRVCWKSEDKIGEGTAEKFVRMIMDKRHDAVIEHGNFILSVDSDFYEEVLKIEDRQYIRMSCDLRGNGCLISGNPRAFRDFCSRPDIASRLQRILAVELSKTTPLLFDDTTRYSHHLSSEDTKHIGIVELFENTDSLSISEKLKHQVASYKIICNRGVTHEIVRHRPFSYAQESTRYCNYKGGVAFIIPPWVKDISCGEYAIEWEDKLGRCTNHTPINISAGEDAESYRWFWAKALSERDYTRAVEGGWIAQQARGHLHIDVKTEIVVTGNLQQWMHFFKLRCSKKAHPQMQEVANMVLVDIRNRVPVMFDEVGS